MTEPKHPAGGTAMSRRLVVVVALLWLATLAAAFLIGHEVGEPEAPPCTADQRALYDVACLDPG